MHEVYWGQYHYENGTWQAVTEPQLSAVSDIHPKGDVTFCGNALTAYAEDFAPVVTGFKQEPGIFPEAASIAILAETRFKAGNTVPVEAVQPLYLRNKVALKTAERMALRGANAQ